MYTPESNVTHEWPGAQFGSAAVGADLRDRLWGFLSCGPFRS